MTQPTSPSQKFGLILCRVIVPLWVLSGAVVKLNAGAPTNLPRTFVDFGRATGLDLGVMLYTLIGLELFAVAVMVLLSRFARPMAIFMLSVFCLVLIGEMIKQADSCGCFGGGIDVQPWQMLIVDGLLLLGVLFFRPPVKESSMKLPQAAAVAAGLAVAGLAVSFGAASFLHPKSDTPEIVDGDVENDPTVNPQPLALPEYWYAEDLDAWVGQPWREVDLFRFMPRWPADMDEGKRYVVFYSRTCDHCQAMFEQHLSQPLGGPVIAVQIPVSRSQLTGANPLFDPTQYDLSQFMQLPIGPDWIITAPLAMRIENGIITCVEEGEHERCLELK